MFFLVCHENSTKNAKESANVSMQKFQLHKNITKNVYKILVSKTRSYPKYSSRDFNRFSL